MSMPTAIFLDTNVFASQQYNFSSTAFNTFIPVCTKLNLKLLLPDPTEREIKRQIRERSQAALNALDSARRKAPFLSKWQSFPQNTSIDNWEVIHIANTEWRNFIKQFQVEKLSYEGVELQTIMKWYDSVEPPFGNGKKRKEFPDAFAISILDNYAHKNNCYIAVVSEDPDIKNACNRYSHLLHFQSISRLTELLLNQNVQINKFHNLIQASIKLLEDPIEQQFEDMTFYHMLDVIEIIDVNLLSTNVFDISVVAIGYHECTITFNVDIEAEFYLEWPYMYSHMDGILEKENEWVIEALSLSGTTKISFDQEIANINSIKYIKLDEPEFLLHTMPRRY